MIHTAQQTMRAVAIDRFGGLDELKVRDLPVPELGPDEVLLHVEYAGVSEWDPFEREGGFAEMTGQKPKFPLVIGSEAAGEVEAVGENVQGIRIGDKVYTAGFLNPKGGTYAEYAVVKGETVAPIPRNLSTEEAAAMPGDAVTALRGLQDVLNVQPGESILIFGAGGGLGHMAIQLAKRLDAHVFAVASGEDGVALAKKLGADAAVDGRKDDIVAAAKAFAPQGIDAALMTAGGEAADEALTTIRAGGRAAYPNGVEPEPQAPPFLDIKTFNGDADAEVIERLNRLIESGPFHVNVARTFTLDEARDAHKALDTHYLGKLALRVRS